jgi:hypothetical protein
MWAEASAFPVVTIQSLTTGRRLWPTLPLDGPPGNGSDGPVSVIPNENARMNVRQLSGFVSAPMEDREWVHSSRSAKQQLMAISRAAVREYGHLAAIAPPKIWAQYRLRTTCC